MVVHRGGEEEPSGSRTASLPARDAPRATASRPPPIGALLCPVFDIGRPNDKESCLTLGPRRLYKGWKEVETIGDERGREGSSPASENQNLGVFSSRDPWTNVFLFLALIIGLLRWSLLPRCTC